MEELAKGTCCTGTAHNIKPKKHPESFYSECFFYFSPLIRGADLNIEGAPFVENG
jgi:hypothetical protein